MDAADDAECGYSRREGAKDAACLPSEGWGGNRRLSCIEVGASLSAI